MEKRKERWLELLAETVTELGRRVDELTPERLAQDEAFITASLHASQIAIRTHKEEKLDALKNAVMNTGLRNEVDEDLQIIFLGLVDRLTPWHLRVLALLDGPEEFMRDNGIANPDWGMGGVATVIEHCFPEIGGNREFYDQIARDLQSEGLIGQGNYLHTTMTGRGMLERRTTGIGGRFLRFIRDPGTDK